MCITKVLFSRSARIQHSCHPYDSHNSRYAEYETKLAGPYEFACIICRFESRSELVAI